MDKKTKRTIMELILFAVLLFAAFTNIGLVIELLKWLFAILFPVGLGLLIAFVLNVPMKAFEKLYYKIFSAPIKKAPRKLVCFLSFFSVLICIALVITLVVTVALPEFIESGKSIYQLCLEKLPEIADFLKGYGIDITSFRDWFTELDLNAALTGFTSGAAGSVVSSVVSIASATVSGLVNVVFALVIAVYVLLSKDTVIRHSKKLIYLVFKKSVADKICEISSLTEKFYTQFFSGQCIEACILGTLMFIAFAIFRLPYAAIIGIMTGISAFIPYIGAFGACGLGAFLILLKSPMQALISIIVFSVVQFIENQFIYPHVVGSSVGLSPLLTLLAALIGGKLMGLFGIIFFIPLTAVAYTILQEHTNRKLAEKQIKIE